MNLVQTILSGNHSQFGKILLTLMSISEVPFQPILNPAHAPDKQQSLKKRIFLVEDHPLMRRSIVEAIEREPDLMVCGQAVDAPTAQDAILSLQPDVVLTDIQLKSSSGLELIKYIHALLPLLPIVATTMFDVRRTERLVRAAGATGFVSKGDGPDALIAIIREALNKAKYDENI
jgi:DNA-binding NarL/FixJ family response regulator